MPLIFSKMRTHQAFPEFAMIGNEEVQQLVDNHVIPKLLIETEQFVVEI